jgi:GntR family transcriptional regulator
MANAGIKASSRVLRLETVTAPDWLAEILQLSANSKVLRVDRLRLGNDEPVAFDITWLPMMYGQLMNKDKLEQTSIYNLLEKDFDIPILRGHYQISAELSDSDCSGYLNIDEGSPLLLISRTSFTIGEKPVYFQKRLYKSDKVRYEMTLEREQGSKSEGMPMKEFIPVFT